MKDSLPKPSPRRSTIRRATPEDFKAVYAWLKEESTQGIHGNFLFNWSKIERYHKQGELLVYVDGTLREPIAFQVRGLIRPGILQVRNGFRGKGVGRKLVEHCVKKALKKNECLLCGHRERRCEHLYFAFEAF